MSEITFIIKNKNNEKIVIEESKKFDDLRNLIKEKFFTDTKKSVKMQAEIQNPIRGFGLMTLNPGNIPFTFDNIKFDKFNLVDKEIPITVSLVEKEVQIKKKNYNSYRPPHKRNQKPVEFKTDLSDDKEFPPLG